MHIVNCGSRKYSHFNNVKILFPLSRFSLMPYNIESLSIISKVARNINYLRFEEINKISTRNFVVRITISLNLKTLKKGRKSGEKEQQKINSTINDK